MIDPTIKSHEEAAFILAELWRLKTLEEDGLYQGLAGLEQQLLRDWYMARAEAGEGYKHFHTRIFNTRHVQVNITGDKMTVKWKSPEEIAEKDAEAAGAVAAEKAAVEQKTGPAVDEKRYHKFLCAVERAEVRCDRSFRDLPDTEILMNTTDFTRREIRGFRLKWEWDNPFTEEVSP